jgi:hypothetical protein
MEKELLLEIAKVISFFIIQAIFIATGFYWGAKLAAKEIRKALGDVTLQVNNNIKIVNEDVEEEK